MKVALINDTHWGSRNDSQIFLDYFIKFYEEIFFPTLFDRKIETIVHLGDVVDRRKFINYRTLQQMRQNFFDIVQSHEIKLHIIIGNHDTAYKNSNHLNSMDCLRVSNPTCTIYEEPAEIYLDELKVLMVPWICEDNYKRTMDMISSTDAQILMGHLEVKGFEMNLGSKNYEGLEPGVFKKFDMAMSGHFHHKSDNGNVYYLGNPYQITWNDYKDPRGFHIFDTETRELEFIQNPFEMFHKIYYDDEATDNFETINITDYSTYKNCYVKIIVLKKTNPYVFDTLIETLYKIDVADITIVENFGEDLFDFDDGEMINEAEDTMTILTKHVNTLEIDNKKDLNNLMLSLYNESLTLEII